MLTWWLVEIVTVKETFVTFELKIKLSGFTSIAMPGGDLITALYLELTGPTFVTVLVRVTVFFRLGTVMEGRLTSRIEGGPLGQNVVLLINLLMEVLLYPMAHR